VGASHQSAGGETADARAYLFTISESRTLNVNPAPGERATQSDARAIRPGEEFAAFDSAESAWYSITFDESTAAQRWDLEVRAAIGRELHARLTKRAQSSRDARQMLTD
jgi:hypothetical protein